MLDHYVYYDRVTGTRVLLPPEHFLVEPEDVELVNRALPPRETGKLVKEIVRDRTVVLHGGVNNLTAFFRETKCAGHCERGVDRSHTKGILPSQA